MSTIGVTFHSEDIHNIIPKPVFNKLPSDVVSSIKLKLKKEIGERDRYNGHQTFGLASYEAPVSWNYLKKGKPKPISPAVKFIDKAEFKCTRLKKNSPIPKATYEKPKRIDKNFVKENIQRIKTIEPKVPRPRRVETPRGSVKDLAHLLQMIKIREREEYGKIPKYLCERRKYWTRDHEKKRIQEQAIKEYKERMGIGVMGMSENVYMVDQETRQKLLDGLKENWNELCNQFSKLPVLIDTWSKIKKKMWLEKRIDELEKDVKLIENHPYIYLERHDKRPYEEIVAEELKMMKEATKQKENEREGEVQETVKEDKETQLGETEEAKQEEEKEPNDPNQ